MMELKIDETNRKLGKQPHTCRICGEMGEFESFLAREMMQGTEEEFVYFVCARCGCLQIAEVPENLGDFYGSGYYSFQVSPDPDMEFDTPVTRMTKVLDVGCGAGAWLLEKAREGWGNLYGCDPFLEKDRHYGSRVTIRSCSIHEMEGEGTFDVIRMGDSFEHMADPLEVMRSARRLLKEDGILYMTIPTYPNVAFDWFGPHWFQLDAPRHLFLHSKESLKYLSEKSNLVLSDFRYNSNNSEFIRSYFYQQGIHFYEQTSELVGKHFRGEDFDRLQQAAEEWNEKERGDHMEVYFRKRGASVDGKVEKVIFLRLSKRENGHTLPYPPVFRQPDADYLCFTDDEKVISSGWDVRLVEKMEQVNLEPFFSRYAIRWEISPNQIQMGPLSDTLAEENLVTVPGDLDFFHGGLDRESSDMVEEEELNCLLQMANEYKQQSLSGDGQESNIWIGLFARGIALAKETGDKYRGKVCVMELLSGLYHLQDRRLFEWTEYLERLFPFSVPERAFLAWCRMCLAFRIGKTAEKVLDYYESYAKYLGQYQRALEDSRDLTFRGLAMVENEIYIMEAKTIAFCCYLKIGEEKKACLLLSELSLEMVANHRSRLFEEGLVAGDEVYEAILAKMTPIQWEKWSGEILDAFLNILFKEDVYRKLLERLPSVLSQISVLSILSWVERTEERRGGIVGRRLQEHVMKCEIQDSSIQVLALAAWLLKQTYEKNGTEEERKKLFPCYVTFMGAFAERYYHPEQLMNAKNRGIAPDILAAYWLAVVLADGKASSENVVILKQALEIFPPFHEEIRNILMSLV